MSGARGPGVGGFVARWASRFRYPTLLAITATVFLLDLAIPDMIPFVDEILLALATGVLASLRKRRDGGPDEAPPDGPRELPG